MSCDKHTVLRLDVSEDHLCVEVESDTGVDQLRLLNPNAQLLSVQRPFSEDQGRRESRVLREVRRMEWLADDVVLEHRGDDRFEDLLLMLLALVVVVVAVKVAEESVVDERFEGGEELELVAALDDVIAEEGLDALLVEWRASVAVVRLMFLVRRTERTVRNCKESDATNSKGAALVIAVATD